jgi:hypothetical protein
MVDEAAKTMAETVVYSLGKLGFRWPFIWLIMG